MKERLEAGMRMLVTSGHLTPYGQHFLQRIIDEETDGGSGTEGPSTQPE